MMTPEERIFRLETIVRLLLIALLKKDTAQDANWGWPSYREQLHAMQNGMLDAADGTSTKEKK